MKERKKRRRSTTSPLKVEIESSTILLDKLPTECPAHFFSDDDSIWWTYIESVVGENPEAAESLAHLFQMLKEAIESGPEGVTRASFILSDGIRLAYENTEAHLKALHLYNLYLAGRLLVKDEPLSLISAAIARAVSEKG